ncbi:MAG: hypothetical protein WAM72_20585, partial [Xanthobacteraceae bacterium]
MRRDKGRLPPFVPVLKDTVKTAAWKALSHGALRRRQAARAIHRGINEMTSIEEKLIGRISAQLTRAVEEANQAYEFAPGSYT